MIKKVPFPICGVMLGTAALGNLLQSYSDTVRNVCGILAAFLLVLILLKLVKYPSAIKEDLDTPVMAGVAATFPMALMILSTYVKPFIGQGAYFIWIFAIVLHVILIVYFTAKFLLNMTRKRSLRLGSSYTSELQLQESRHLLMKRLDLEQRHFGLA